ncbi:MAG: hypothetical protein ACI8TP_000973 [Acidimicrobiales bacterium]|jgi:hypothetical protein
MRALHTKQAVMNLVVAEHVVTPLHRRKASRWTRSIYFAGYVENDRAAMPASLVAPPKSAVQSVTIHGL